MSSTIDQRVVEMRFDNRQFENGVQTSLSTLDKLKDGLNLSGAAKWLENINSAASRINFGPMSSAVETVHAKFSALEIMAISALTNITNSAVNTAKKLVSEFTIEPITTGFQEFELKMGSVQTIMASTGASLDDVNGYLAELNEYSDKTIYSFADMTNNIGKFTNAGVKLEDAVLAIKGISNEAAVSGANAQEASRAMYNFSQALSAGYVKLIDWKSIENANMATVEFKEELMKTAVEVGTLTKTGEDYISTTTDMNGKTSALFNATRNFNDSLSAQWMTTEVLTKTLAKYADETTEIGKKAYASAQDVKTFSMMMDTLKEAAQSGWATTWELIVGDFEEGKSLWTNLASYFGDIIDKSADARNSVIEGWKNMGGRDMAIEAITNAFNALLSILKPIKEAFREIFPPVTSQMLMRLTTLVRDFTTNLKITGEQAAVIRDIFKGVFSVIRSGIEVFVKLGYAIFSLLGNFKGIGSAVLEAASSIRSWLSGLAESIKQIGIFSGAIEKLNSFLSGMREKFEESGESSNIISKIVDKFKELVDLFKGNIKFPAFDGLLDTMGVAWNKIKELASGIGTAFKEGLRSGDFKAALDLLNSGILTTVLMNVSKFFKGISGEFSDSSLGVIDSIKDVIGNLSNVFDSVRSSLETWQQSLKADVLMKIASAIGILALSLISLSFIDPDKLTNALVMITGMFAELVGSISIMNKMEGFDASFGTASTTMIKMSVAVLILCEALKQISDIDFGSMVKGLVGLTVMLGELTIATMLLSEYGGKSTKAGKQMILMALAMEIFADVCKKLGALSWLELAKSMAGMGAILLEFVGFQKLMSLFKPKQMMNSSKALVLIGAAMEIFADVCKKFGQLEWESLGKSGAAIAGILVIASGFGLLAGMSKGMVGSSVALVIIATGMEIFADVCKKFGQLEWESLGKSGAAMAGILLLAAGFGLLAGLAPGMAGSSAALVIMAAGMEIFADICKKFGEMEWESLGKAGAAIAGILAIAAGFGLLAGLAPGMLAGAAALLIMAGALATLTPTLVIFGNMELSEIGTALLMMAGAFTVLGLAGLLLEPLVPAILGLSAAVALLGVGALACGAGVTLLATGLGALAVTGAAGMAALVAVIMELIGLIPAIIEKIGEGLVLLLQVVAEASVELCDACTQIGLALLDTLTQLIPPLVDVVILAVMKILDVLAENSYEIVDKVITIVLEIVKALTDRINDIVAVVVDFVIAVINTVEEQGGRLVQAGVDLVVNLINGLAEGIIENEPRIKEALINLCTAMIKAFCDFFGIASPSKLFMEYGGYIVQGLINGIGEFVSSAVEKITSLATAMASAIQSKLSEFKTKGAQIITSIKEGISSKVSLVTDTVKSMASEALSVVKEKITEFKTVGFNMIEGFKEGIKSAATNAVEAAKGVASDALEGAKKLLGIKSPSREFKKIGKYICEGFANGLEDNSKSVFKGTTKICKEILNTSNEYANKVAETMQIGSGAMKAYLNQYGKFGLSLEKNTGLVNKAASSVQNYATALYNSSEQYQKDIKSLSEHEAKLNSLYAKRAELQKEVDNSASETNIKQLNSDIKSLDKEIDTLSNKIITDNDNIQQHITDTYNNVRNGLKNTVKQAISITSIGLDTGIDLFSKFQTEAETKLNNIDPFTKFAETAKSALSSINPFEKYEPDDLAKGTDIFESMNSQIDANTRWKRNLDSLVAKGVSSELMAYLKNMGIEGSKYVESFLSMTEDQIAQANEKYAQLLDLSGEGSGLDILGNMKSQIDGHNKWAENMTELAEKGLGEPLLEYLRNLGPESTEEINAFLKMTADEIAQANDYYSEILKIDTTSGILNDMQSQIDGVKEWKSNLEELKKSGLSKGILDELEAMGPEGASKVRSFLALTGEELAKANEYYNEKVKLSADAFLENFTASITEQANWADNIKALVDQGFDVGVIEALGEAGAKGSEAYVEALMSMTPEQVEELNKTYAKSLAVQDSVADSVMASYAKAGEMSTDAYIASIESETGKVTSATVDIYSDVANKTGELTYPDWFSTGEYSADGIIKGVKNKVPSMKKTLKDFANSAVSTVRSILKIKSPSRVFMEIGGYVSEGFANGITNSANLVDRSINDITNGAISNASSIITTINDAMNGGSIDTPTISPVINMDDIRAEQLKVTSSLDAVMSEPIESLGKLMDMIQTGIEKSNEKVAGIMNNLRDDVNKYYSKDNDREVSLYVDSKKLATSIAKPINRELNILSKRGI